MKPKKPNKWDKPFINASKEVLERIANQNSPSEKKENKTKKKK